MNAREEPEGRPRLSPELPGAQDLAAPATRERAGGEQRFLAEADAERARLRDLFAQAPGLVAVVRGPEHVFDVVNAAYVRAVGRRDAAELLGRPVREALPELVGQGYVELLDRVFATGEPFVGSELPVILDRQGNGTREERFFNFVYQPIRGAGGVVEGIFGHAVDVTDLVRSRRRAEAIGERLSLAQAAGRIGTFEWDLQTGEVVWTPELEALYGLAPDGFGGRFENWERAVHPDDRARAVAEVERTARGGTQDGADLDTEFRVVWPDGTVRHLAARARVVRGPDGAPLRMVGVNVDITERIALEESLRRSELRFRTIIEQFPLSTQVFAPDGTTLTVNRAWEALWGVTLDRIRGYNVLEDPQLAEKGVMPYIRQGFAGEPAEIPPIEYVPADTIPDTGAVPSRWVRAFIFPVKDEAGSIREVVLIHEDVTERKRAEEALRASEERLRKAVSIETVGVLFFNLDGTIAGANGAFGRMCGYGAGELRAIRHWETLTPPEFMDATARAARELAERGETAPYEKQLLRKDGSRFWGLFAPTRLAGSGGDSECVEFVVDLTERKRAEAARERALGEAERRREEAERARTSLQTFLGVVAHDLRSPLTAIRGNAQMLRRRGAAVPPERLERALGAIEEQARRMNELIGYLVDAARIGAGQLEVRPEATDLAALAGRAVDAAQAGTERHRVVLEAPGRLEGEWDPDRLAQVLDNLLGNAVKYSPGGGEIRVRLTRQDDRAVLSVSDQGIGIRREDTPRLFELFSRLEPGRTIEGTGLGLYIARGIVEAHGGRIWAESAGPGRGSTFSIALPVER